MTVAFHRGLLDIAGDAWLSAFRAAVTLFGGGEEIVAGYSTAISGDLDIGAARAGFNCLRFTREAAIWG
jgi:hypothetical protein